MKCTCCKKALAVGDWFCVAEDHRKNVSLPFCSFHCLGSYFSEWTNEVTQKLLHKLSYGGDRDLRLQSDVLEYTEW